MVNQPVAASDPIIEVREACKNFGKVQALIDVSMEVRRGEVMVIIAPVDRARARYCAASTTWSR